MKRKPSIPIGLIAMMVIMFVLILRMNGNSSKDFGKDVASGISEIASVAAEIDAKTEMEPIRIESETRDLNDEVPYENTILIPISITRELTQEDITGLSRDELVLCRVEILSYHGIDVMSGEEVDLESILSDIELYNLEFLGEAVENAAGINVSIVEDNEEVTTEHGIPKGVTFWADPDSVYEIMFDTTWPDGVYRVSMYVRGTDKVHKDFPSGQKWYEWDDNPNVLVSENQKWKLMFCDYGERMIVGDSTSGEEKSYSFTRVKSE